MRKLLLLSILLVLVIPAFAQISGLVNDQANVLSAQDKARIESVLKNIYDSKQAEYAVVIVQSLEGQDIEGYALNLAQGNLGDTEKNNGLLLLVAVEDRQYRFEVGRGIEPILNDAKVGRIGRNFLVENFQSGNYGQGILEASVAIADELGVGLTGDIPRVTQRRSSSLGTWISFFMFFIFFSSLFAGTSRRYNKRNRFFNAALMAGLMFGGRGRGGLGGMGGMGGGFGGGGFGGGGASGGW
ncbi:TPM domain-containing protein [Candidatus Woesearchaeota archaeon]|nr:TPM domain-containing protein [Candidatus Woesearchaeota archaeon]